MILGKVSSQPRNVPGAGDTLSSGLVKVSLDYNIHCACSLGQGYHRLTPITEASSFHPAQESRTQNKNFSKQLELIGVLMICLSKNKSGKTDLFYQNCVTI